MTEKLKRNCGWNLMSSAYLQNRGHTKAIETTAYERWTGNRPHLKIMRL